MKITIITVVFNAVSTIKDTLESVKNQNYSDIEHIVVDGQSNDGTLSIIESYRRYLAHVISEPDQGLYDAMNKGLNLATGDIIGILNADDVYQHKCVLSHVVNTLNQTQADGLYADLVYVDAKNPDKVIRKWKSGSYKSDYFLYGWMPPHPTFFVRRAIYQQYGGFNTRLKSAADYELMLRFIHKRHISLVYLSETIVRMRAGGLSNAHWRLRWQANREDRLSWKLNSLTPLPITFILKPLRKIIQFIYLK